MLTHLHFAVLCFYILCLIYLKQKGKEDDMEEEDANMILKVREVLKMYGGGEYIYIAPCLETG